MDSHFLDMLLTVVVLSFWFVFPIGMFLSVSQLDKSTDQLVRLDSFNYDPMDLRYDSIDEGAGNFAQPTPARQTGEIKFRNNRKYKVHPGGKWQVSYRH